MKSDGKWRAWLLANRTSARISFGLRLATTALSSVLSLFWAPVFLSALGKEIYGLLLSFQGVIRLATLGDFGITGALGVRTGQMIGRGEQERLERFVASARSLFLFMALIVGTVFALLSPWLPGWLNFKETAGAGALTALFAMGGLFIVVSYTDGYSQSLNSGCGTVLWPIVPAFLMGQITMLAQWLVAKQGGPLWALLLAQCAVIAVHACFSWWILKAAFPRLARLWPFEFNRTYWRGLLTASGWVSLYTLGHFIFTMTDRLLINAGFGSGTVPPYYFNYKPVEMLLMVILSAISVSQGKLNIWMANPAAESQTRARDGVQRLNLFQSLAGTVCAVGYLAFINLFIDLWVGSEFRMPWEIQFAFALTLVVTTAGDASIQVAGICGHKGLRVAGLTIGLTGLLNLALSFASMRHRWLAGIAFATVVAQTILTFTLGRYVCRYLGMPLRAWYARSWVMPVITIGVVAWLQFKVGTDHWSGIVCVLGVGGVLVLVQARLAGMTREFVFHEWSIIRGMLGHDKKH